VAGARRRTPARQLTRVDFEREQSQVCIYSQDIAVFDQRERAADSSFSNRLFIVRAW
jgi:hypothetical protein